MVFLPGLLSRLTSAEPKKRRLILLAVGAAALCLLLAVWPFSQKKEAEEEVPSSQSASEEAEAYRRSLQEQLEQLLSDMEGVGRAQVLLTVESGASTSYQSDFSRQSDRQSDGEVSSLNTAVSESVVLVEDSDGNTGALVQSVSMPRVLGAAVVCDGGGSAAVQKRISDALCALLDISAGQVSVSPRAG